MHNCSGTPIMLINDTKIHRHVEARPPDFYTSFLAGLNAEIPAAAGAWANRRASIKYQQREIDAGDLLAINTGAITEAFNGEAVHPGLIVDNFVASDVINSDDMANVAWAKVRCNVSVKNLVDPYGVANEAQMITPTGAPPGHIRRQSGNACGGLNYVGGVWLASVDGPPHTARVAVVRSAAMGDNRTEDVALDFDWQWIDMEHLFGVGAGFSRFYIYPDILNSTKRVKARLPFQYRDSDVLVNPTETTTQIEDYFIAAPVGARGDQGSFSIWVRPNHQPGDPGQHLYFQMYPLNANPLSNFAVGCVAGQVGFAHDLGGAPQGCFTLATDVNFPRGRWVNMAGFWDATGRSLLMNGEIVDVQGAMPPGPVALPGGAVFQTNFVMGGVPSSAMVSRIRVWYEALNECCLQQIYLNEHLEYGI